MTDYPIDLLSLPAGADPKSDRIVSMDDAGRPVYQSRLGDQYVINYQMQTREGLPTRARNALTALYQDPAGTVGNALMGAAKGVWDGVQVPANALMTGRMPTNGELLNTVGLMAGGMGSMAAPEGALRSGALRTERIVPKVVEDQHTVTFLVEKNGETAGMVAYKMPDGGLQVDVTQVPDSMQRQGISTALHDAGLDWAEKRGGQFLSGYELTQDGKAFYDGLARKGYGVNLVDLPNGEQAYHLTKPSKSSVGK